ncbi:MAG: HAD family phosphatase [Bacteroidales bacterium]|nr:HAD family phosphatase [Bacteroidales bacterium]
MIKNIVFDFGGVLVDWNPHYLYDGYFGSREKADWFLANICTMDWNVQMDGGKSFAQGIAELSAVHPQWSREIQMYFDRWMDMMGEEIPHMRELIQDLKRRGYRIFGLTNWSAETFCQVRHRYGIFDLLEGMTVSGEEHVTKPDQAIYRRLLERFSLVPGECLFIDDNAANVAGAIQAGMAAVRFTDPATLKEYLDTLQ